MAKRFWTNDQTRVWLINPPSEPLLLPYATIELIEWPSTAIICVPLPTIAGLTELQGITFEIRLFLKGTYPDIYENGVAIVRLSNCRIGKRIEHPVAHFYSDTEGRIELKLILDCDIELFTDVEL